MKIRGNTIGTTIPKPNLEQTDPSKGDYVKGKEAFLKNAGGGGGLPDDMEQVAMLCEADMLPAVHDASGKILTDENGNVILRY